MSKGSAQEIVGEIMNPTVEGRYPSLDRRIRAKIAGAIIAPIALTGCSMEVAPFSNTGMEIRNDALNPDRITALIDTVTSIREQGGKIQYSKDNRIKYTTTSNARIIGEGTFAPFPGEPNETHGVAVITNGNRSGYALVFESSEPVPEDLKNNPATMADLLRNLKESGNTFAQQCTIPRTIEGYDDIPTREVLEVVMRTDKDGKTTINHSVYNQSGGKYNETIKDPSDAMLRSYREYINECAEETLGIESGTNS